MKNSHFLGRWLHLQDMLPPFGRALIVLAAFLALAIAWVSVNKISEIETRMGQIEQGMASMDRASYVTIDGRVFMQTRSESRAEWLFRVRSIALGNGEGNPPGYNCTLLSGCDIPGGTVLVCTPQGEDHDADVREACRVFDCDC